jgi:hypothetical protein
VVEAVPPDGADQPLGERILPGTPVGDEDLLDAHAPGPLPKDLAVDSVPITQSVLGGILPWERLHDLLGGPRGSRVRGDVEVQNPPTVVGEYEKHEEDLTPNGRYDEEVDRDDLLDVVLQEGTLGGGGWLPSTHHVILDGRLGHLDPNLSEFANGPGSSSERIRGGHPPDQISQLLHVPGYAGGTGPGGKDEGRRMKDEVQMRQVKMQL